MMHHMSPIMLMTMATRAHRQPLVWPRLIVMFAPSTIRQAQLSGHRFAKSHIQKVRSEEEGIS